VATTTRGGCVDVQLAAAQESLRRAGRFAAFIADEPEVVERLSVIRVLDGRGLD
jgi:hypothetical protein